MFMHYMLLLPGCRCSCLGALGVSIDGAADATTAEVAKQVQMQNDTIFICC